MTRYHYPTWADILGQQWEYYENWGKPGQGNTFIFNSIIECLNRNQFNSNDTVMIMWTSISRIDYYQLRHWYSKINLFSTNKNEAINCPDGYELLNYPLMYAIHNILDQKNIKYKSMTWTEYDDQSPVGSLYRDTISRIQKINFQKNKNSRYYKYFNEFNSNVEELYSVFAGPDWPDLDKILRDTYTAKTPGIQQEIDDFLKAVREQHKKEFIEFRELDRHPLPSEYLRVVKLEFPDIEISDKTINLIDNIEQDLNNGDPVRFKSSLPRARISI